MDETQLEQIEPRMKQTAARLYLNKTSISSTSRNPRCASICIKLNKSLTIGLQSKEYMQFSLSGESNKDFH